MGRSNRGWTIYLIIMGAFVLLMWILPSAIGRSNTVTLTSFREQLKNGEIQRATVTQNAKVPTGSVIYELADGNTAEVLVSDVNEIQQELQKNNVSYDVSAVAREGSYGTIILGILAGVLVLSLIMGLFTRMQGGAGAAGGGRMMDFGRSRARMSTDADKKIRFSDVAGLKEEKEDLVEIVDFLKNPQRYTNVGARIPKGVILVGPPGTGKTLLAKAVAGEAGVPFFSISGSDFVEMFVGVGASRVRDLFDQAKKNAPCIVFIDEIDAVGRRRGTGMGGGHDEREQTLNQLLVEMDGFGLNEGIIVMAATNRVDILDPAILRPGRFDRQVVVGRPDVQGREEILKVHAKGKPLADDVDLEAIAQTTAGFTGADLENLLNEAAIRAAKENRPFLNQKDIKDAFIRVGVGTEKKSKVVSEEEKRITAYHETGHAILFHVLPDMDPVHMISIIPTGGAAGYTMPQPERDEMFNTRGKMLQRITTYLGGRVAEELIFDDITTGASMDIKQATSIARSMVTKYGMSDNLGLVNYDDDSDDVFLGYDLGHKRSFSEEVAASIDNEVKNIIESCHEKARAIIIEHRFVLHECARQLMEREKLSRAEFEAIFAMEAEQSTSSIEAAAQGVADQAATAQEGTQASAAGTSTPPPEMTPPDSDQTK